jgi:FlaA1/EpsC-like NDP-sugar epimerase
MVRINLNKLNFLQLLSSQVTIFILDVVLILVAIFLSFSLDLKGWFWPESKMVWLVILSSPVLVFLIFKRFGIYDLVISYIEFRAMWLIVLSVSLYSFLWGGLILFSEIWTEPYSIIFNNWTISLLLLTGSRAFIRWLFVVMTNKSHLAYKQIIIYGAGEAGLQLCAALQLTKEFNPTLFVDDDNNLQGRRIKGLKVYSPENLSFLIDKMNISEIFVAMPSLSRTRRKKIIDALENYPVIVRSLPGVAELAQGKVEISDLREVSIKDLLGRNPVPANKNLLNFNIKNKVVMVTGAGGSIGSELCRQILFLKPKTLILFELSEFALYTIHRKLSEIDLFNIEIVPILGSVNNKKRLGNIFRRFGVQTIYHAAAYKHVPMVEFNNTEGVSNNVLGTLSCAQVAIDEDVETFVLISTDKAVRPTNTMGATKRCSEMVLQALSAKQSSTCFTMVRFGNVLGSSGSVIPLFKQQIETGGPVTVTDADIIRYFMTISEAVELVIQAGAMGKGGDVFVLDMGKPIRIVDLAKKMIRLSGLQVKDETNPDGDIEIEYIGLRPGEKLYEELLIGDNVLETDNPMIMQAQEDMLAWDDLKPILNELELAIEKCDQQVLRELLIRAVPEFKPQCGIKDVLFNN